MKKGFAMEDCENGRYELVGHQLIVNGEFQPVDRRTVRVALRLYPVETGGRAPSVEDGKAIAIPEELGRFILALESRFSTENLAAEIEKGLQAA